MTLHHTETLRTLFERFETGEFDAILALCTDDVELHLPFQDTSVGFLDEIVGAPAVRDFLAVIPRMFDPHRLVLDDLIPAADPGLMIARYHGDFVARSTGKPYRNTYVALFRFEGDRVRCWTEFHNPQVLAQSLGT